MKKREEEEAVWEIIDGCIDIWKREEERWLKILGFKYLAVSLVDSRSDFNTQVTHRK